MKLARVLCVTFLIFSSLAVPTLLALIVYAFVDSSISENIIPVVIYLMGGVSICLILIGLTVKVNPDTRIKETNREDCYKNKLHYTLKTTWLDNFVYSFCVLPQSSYSKKERDKKKEYHNHICPLWLKPIIHKHPLNFVKSIIRRLATKCK